MRKTKEDKSTVVTAAKTNSLEIKQQEQTTANKSVKKQRAKKKKTAGLILPISTAPKTTKINLQKLSQIFQQQQLNSESQTPQAKLNQFFK